MGSYTSKMEQDVQTVKAYGGHGEYPTTAMSRLVGTLLAYLRTFLEGEFETQRARTILNIFSRGETHRTQILSVSLLLLKKTFTTMYQGNEFSLLVDTLVGFMKNYPLEYTSSYPPCRITLHHKDRKRKKRPKVNVRRLTWRDKRPRKIDTNLPVSLPKDFEKLHAAMRKK